MEAAANAKRIPSTATERGSPGYRRTLLSLVESRGFNAFIIAVIVVNAVTLGLETSQRALAAAGPLLYALDRAAMIIFTIEIALRITAHRTSFFRGGWNLFDFFIVAISWIPAAGAFSVLRAMRILRVLRLLSVVPQMRKIIGALLSALPGMGSVIAVLLLVFYVSAVMATQIFGSQFPQWFGSVGASMFSLFQIMTLESWSMGIVRPVMEVYPHAWAFFVPFLVITSFTVLNLFIALMVNSMQTIHAEDRQFAMKTEEMAHEDRLRLMDSIEAMRKDLLSLQQQLDRRQ
jgi:voltage-gated sodium channel